MDIVNSFISHHRNKLEVNPRELAYFSIGVMKEAIRIEHNNTGTPGKAAIEFLLNTKYQLIENKYIEIPLRDVLLEEIDHIIKKFVVKYKIKTKGKNFYFDESLEFVQPQESGCVIGIDQSSESDLYQLNTKLEVAKIQLARTPLNSSKSLELTLHIKELEQQISNVKKELIKQDYYTHYDPLYRRSLGEARNKEMTAKDAAKAGAAAGTIGGAVYSSSKFKKDTKFDSKRKAFQNSSREKDIAHRELMRARDNFDRATKGSSDKVVNTFKTELGKAKKSFNKANKTYNASLKTVSNLQGEANKRFFKGGAKGALLGAAAGLAALGAKKYADSHKKNIKESLDKYINKLKEKHS